MIIITNHYAIIHCKDCYPTTDILDKIKKPSMNAVKMTSKKTYLCMVHANIRGYTTTKKYICLDEYLLKDKKNKELLNEKKDNQSSIEKWC